MNELPLTSNPKETRAERRAMYQRMRMAGRALKDAAALDAVLNAPENDSMPAEMKAHVRTLIQDACPWLRDTAH